MIHPLPYQDQKPLGAADFYFAINATFRFIRKTLGEEALKTYWSDLGRTYMAPVTQQWKQGGLSAIAEYWQAFFAAEPGAEVEVNIVERGKGPSSQMSLGVDSKRLAVILEVRTCPAIRHLRGNGRDIDPGFCQHCYYVSEAAALPAGFTVRVQGGNGSCRQTFLPLEEAEYSQDLHDIQEAS